METKHKEYIWKNYRIQLHNLTDEQKAEILRISNARRFLYNWALDLCNESYQKTGKIPNYQEIAREYRKLKSTDGYEWLRDIYSAACIYTFIDLSNAFHNFFIGICRRPKHKRRKEDSIRFACDPINVSFKGNDGRYAYIPVLSSKHKGLVDCGSHNIPFGKGIKYSNTRIKFDGVNYWLSMSVKMTVPIEYDNSLRNDDIIGIDVGVRTIATLSNGKVYNDIDRRRLRILDHRKRVLQSAVDRDVQRRLKQSDGTIAKYYDIPKSKNQLKRERKLAITRIGITNIYKNYFHNISREIANQHYSTIVLETLNTSRLVSTAFGEARNSIYQARMTTLAEYIEYKCSQDGSLVIHADKEYPSSQICSNCGHSYKIGKEKIYKCPLCGLEIDRDLNAAYNLRDFGMKYLDQRS